MGQVFNGTRKAVVANPFVVQRLIEASVILLLHGNAKYADEVEEAVDSVLLLLEGGEINEESMLHGLVQQAFERIMKDKPYHVKAALSAVLDAVMAMAAEKITFDLDNALSPDEIAAWKGLLNGVKRAARIVSEAERQ